MKDNLSDLELGYIAGIIDGEGCISINKQHHKTTRVGLFSRTLTLEVQNTNLSLLEWIQERLGGNIRVMPVVGNRKIAYRISWSAANASNILKIILKYLIVKKQQASWGIMLQELKNERGHSGGIGLAQDDIDREEFIFEQFTRLNKRGIS